MRGGAPKHPRPVVAALAVMFLIPGGPALSAPVTLRFSSQPPEAPGVYDAPTASTWSCTTSVADLAVILEGPGAGVTTSTGVLVILPGIGAGNDCQRELSPPDPSWADSRDLVVAEVFYRNLAFYPPYDFGKYQVVDVLRGLGAVLERYPQVDRRRLYLFGGSGGGQLALQVAQCSRHLWSEVHVHCAITRMTLPGDVAGSYESDPASTGWNVNLGFPTSQGALSDLKWERYQGERDLRSPQVAALRDPMTSRGGTIEAPVAWMMHGTADAVVDVQHLYDYMAGLEAATGGPLVEIEPGHRWSLDNWTFVSIAGGGHSYAGAAPDEDTRAKATNKYVPDAFRRLRSSPPSMVVDYVFPTQHGWRYHVSGASLGTVSLGVEGPLAGAGNWAHYQ